MHDYLPETYRLVNIDYKRQESFYFAKTFIEHFCDGELPYGAIGGKIHDDYQKQVFPDYRPRKNSRDVFRPILKGVVELWQNGEKIDSYTTDFVSSYFSLYVNNNVSMTGPKNIILTGGLLEWKWTKI